MRISAASDSSSLNKPAAEAGRVTAALGARRLADRQYLMLTAAWLLLALFEMLSRSFIPVDETRYVTVAWNMHLNGDFLVPMLNGMPYSDKPPLLFWLINLGWTVFGVSDWWPRLLTSLIGLGNAWLTVSLAKRLWPGEKDTPIFAALVLSGSILWAAMATAVMFDMLLSFFTLFGLLGALLAMQEKRRRAWTMVAVAIAGGLLAKGPAIFLHLLPALLLAPWWRTQDEIDWRSWYASLGMALLAGLFLALLWAIPAALHGGSGYAEAIFWGQSAHRVVDAFAHHRELWWYLPLLPILFFPWLLWGTLWQGAGRLMRAGADAGTRFCLAWLVSAFILFSLVSGKQIHYLLPLLPAFALLAAHAVQFALPSRLRHGLPVLLVFLTLAILLLYFPHHVHRHLSATWLENIPVWVPLVMGAGSIALWCTAGSSLQAKVWSLSLISMLLAAVVHLGIIHPGGAAYDMRPIATQLKHLEERGVPLAHAGPYPGIYDFVGRLQRSPHVLDRLQLSKWFAAHPQGRAIVYFNSKNPRDGLAPEFLQDYLKEEVGVVDSAQWETWCSGHLIQCGRPAHSPATVTP